MDTASTNEVGEVITLDHSEILEYQKNRFPYLMLDRATAVRPGVSADGYKNLSNSDWFFQCHFPGDPNMPGMLQAEERSSCVAEEAKRVILREQLRDVDYDLQDVWAKLVAS